MTTIALRNLHKVAAGLTQAGRIPGQDGALQLGALSRPQVFTRTYMASLSGDFLFEVGAGRLDPVRHTRLLMQYALDQNRAVEDVANEYLELLALLGKSSEPFRRIVAGIMGTADRAVSRNNQPTVTPTYIYKLVESAVPSTNAVLLHMLTDYVCHMLRPMGWVIADAGYVYRMRRIASYPRYKDLVDVMNARNIMQTLQSLADADLSLVKSAMEKKGSLLPAMVAQHLANAVMVAYELSRGTYDAVAIVQSVLTVLGRVWSPNTPKELAPSVRITKQPVFAELVGNLSLFLAYQDMVTSGEAPMLGEEPYSDEEMASQILPLFSSAMAEISPFKLRVLTDTISFMGKKSARDHLGRPGYVVAYEEWDFTSGVTAFTTIRQDQTSEGVRFIEVQPQVSSALETAMRPVRSVLNMSNLVATRLGGYELSAASSRSPTHGCDMILGLPSLLEREVSEGVPVGELQTVILQGGYGLYAGEGNEARREFIDSLRFDYYSTLMHLATARSDETRITVQDESDAGVPAPVLFWQVRTTEKVPLGFAAINQGEVITAEPLERLAYMEDFSPTEALQSAELPLEEHRMSLHLWDWYKASNKLSLLAPYLVTIRNKSYEISVDEHEMLGLGARRRSVRFMRPTMATAIARLWLEWLTAENDYIDSQISKSKGDTLILESLRGRKVQTTMKLVSLLTSVGTQGAGAYAKRFIKTRLAGEMAGRGLIDEYSDIHVGVQAHRLNVWAGLVTMRLLGLITFDEANYINDYLAQNDALALVVGTIDLPMNVT